MDRHRVRGTAAVRIISWTVLLGVLAVGGWYLVNLTGSETDDKNGEAITIFDPEMAEEELDEIAENFKQAIEKKQNTQPQLEAARRLAEKYPDWPEVYKFLGHIHEMRKEYAEALEHYNLSLERNENQPEIELQAGTMAYQLDAYEVAKTHYAQAVSLDPDMVKYREHLAQANIRLKNFDEAKKILLRVLDRDSSAHRAHAILSDLYAAQNNHELAMQQIQKALDMIGDFTNREEFVTYTRKKAKILRDINQPDQSLQVLDQSLTLLSERNDPLIVADLAESLEMLDRHDLAAEQYEKAIPGNATDFENLELILAGAAHHRIAAGDLKQANDHMGQLRAISPNAPVINELEKEYDRRKNMQGRETPLLQPE